MPVSANDLVEYLTRYVEAYRREYERLISPPPSGGGFPPLEISPYLYTKELVCLLSPDGVAILDQSREPASQWWIIGGIAFMADLPQSRTPPEVVKFQEQSGFAGKNIGIYRFVAKNGIPPEVWRGELSPVQEEVCGAGDNPKIIVRRFALSRLDVIQRLTFGTIGLILGINLQGPQSDFWNPHIIQRISYLTADRQNRRFINYLELLPHTDSAAWDYRSITTRAYSDVRRDFGIEFSSATRGGRITWNVRHWTQIYNDRLMQLKTAIEGLATLLIERGADAESVFHNFLADNPILLDVYGEPISKPRLIYPEGKGPLGKTHVEPDFIVRYPGNVYRLIELERPSKLMATSQGQPRAEVNQATFQIAEWRAYIANHYDCIKERFPGIAVRCSATVVISRSTEQSIGTGRDFATYKEYLWTMYRDIEIMTYDDLLERARQAYIRLASIGLTAGAEKGG